MFKVVATETFHPLALNADIHNALPTEKVDGTCCYVANHKDFIWNVDEDLRPVPDFWIPAKGVKKVDGKPCPDENGHIPGTSGSNLSWVPVENGNKQYCWHSSAVNYTLSVALVLKPRLEDPESLEICLVHLTELLEQTLELLHRHHLGLSWPLKDTYLNSKPVFIRMNLCKYEEASHCLAQFAKIDALRYDSLKDVLLD
ncbi:hypothetical protein AB205_0172270 [Aquarana catesbeiana]|uniref:RNA ligase 1 n=1 Tax=Aquarana catesbeiana TaxID=8400 RepID=A0A2G9SIN6_AQUCT|nr:hypothetical protein AB205_0172270 [Aquarana catesbeiana]